MKRPPFSLRDLMWLALVAGLILGWRMDHFHQLKRVDLLSSRLSEGELDRIVREQDELARKIEAGWKLDPSDPFD